MGTADPLGTAAHIYKGYVEEVPLTPEEEEVLPCLIASRLVQVPLSPSPPSIQPTNCLLSRRSSP
jgi:Ser/Thr protein kinase RdoA (MazF antagonist)